MSDRKNMDEQESSKLEGEYGQEPGTDFDPEEGFDQEDRFHSEKDLDPDDDLDLEGNIRLNPRKAAIFLGLVILAVLICIALWIFTHRSFEGENSDNAGTSETGSVLAQQASGEGLEGGESAAKEDEGACSAKGESIESSQEQAQPSESISGENSGIQPGTGETVQTDNPSGNVGEMEENGFMSFAAASDRVTAKDETNLRSTPTTTEDNVVGRLLNGATAERTGVNEDTGWSRLDYNGQTVYAVTRYLTTDLAYQTPVTPTDPNRIITQDGRTIIFADWDDYITPKEYVNLRTEPSTSQGDATVRCQVNSGENIHRTGYSQDSGWSRVEYNGEILYVVSSYVVTVTE